MLNSSAEQAPTGLIAWFARNPVAAYVLLGLLVVGGLVAVLNTPVGFYPTVEPREVVVTIRYPGASTEQVESDIVRRIEAVVGGLSGVERVTGVASPELAVISIEARNFADPEAIRREASNAIRGLENFPPPGVRWPEIELRTPITRIATVALYSQSAGEDELRLAAEELREQLLAIPQVLRVDLEGVRDREITVEVSPEQLSRHGLSITEVAAAVGGASTNTAVGQLRAATEVFSIESEQRRVAGVGLRDIVLIEGNDGAKVTVGDVAAVRDGFVEDRVFTNYQNANAALLKVAVRSRESVFDAGAAIEELVAAYPLPENFHMEVWDNTFARIDSSLDSTFAVVFVGLAVAWVCLLLVFGLRIAFFTTLGIPLSILGSFGLMALIGVEFSIFTYLFPAVFIGIVVDDAIVVAEGVASAKNRGMRGIAASIAGARAVARPVTLGVATTLMVMVPFLFMTEPDFQIFITFALVGFCVLGVSLVEAFLILPRHLGADSSWDRPPLTRIQLAVGRFLDDMRDGAVAAAEWSIRHVWVVPGLTLLFFVVFVALLQTGALRISLTERTTFLLEYVQLEIELPVGSSESVTAAVAERYAAAAAGINDVLPDYSPIAAISTSIGQFMPQQQIDIPQANSHSASVRAHLRSNHFVNSEQVAEIWRQLAGPMPEVELERFWAVGSAVPNNVDYILRHDDPQVLREAALRVRAFLEAREGVSSVIDSMRLGERGFEIELTPEGRTAGFTEAMVANELRTRLHGFEVDRVQRGRDEILINVRYPQRSRASMGDLRNELLLVPEGADRMRLSTAAELVEGRDVYELMRVDGKPAVTISARANVEIITPDALYEELMSELGPSLRNDFPGIDIQVAGALRAATRTVQLVSAIFAVALLAIYVLLAAFQRSYWRPLLTLAGVPVCAVGAFLLHFILGWSPNVGTLLGIIAVSGIVLNDGLVLLDRFSILRAERAELPVAEIAKQAMESRFRAVLMTSVTTIVALCPVFYIPGELNLLLSPFVLSMVGGSTAAALYVLFVMPAMLVLVEGGAGRLQFKAQSS